MSAEATVRISRLDLKVEHRDLALPFRNDLEDALRTAGMPRLPSGARLFVRRLRLGRIPAGLGRQALSRYLDARLAAIEYVVAQPDIAVAVDADAVLVPDLVAGAAIAIDAIERDQPLPWFLSQLFPDLGSRLADDAIAHVAERLIAEAGHAAPGRLAEIGGGGRRLMRLLCSLPAESVRYYLASIDRASPTKNNVSRPVGVSSDAWSRHRSITEYPSAIYRPVIDAILASAGAAARNEISSIGNDLPADPERLHLLAAWLAIARAGPSAAAHSIARLQLAIAMSATNDRSHVPARDNVAIIGINETIQPFQSQVIPRTRRSDLSVPTGPSGDEVHDDLPMMSEPVSLAGATSRHAGLWLLLPALQLVGLHAAERATGLPLGHAILSSFADRLGLSQTDPARLGLSPAFEMEAGAPDGWLPRPDIMRLVSGGRDLEYTRIRSGKAIVGLRHGGGILAVAGPNEVRAIRAAGCGLRPAEYPVAYSPGALRYGLILATQRLVSRSTGRGWRRLVSRHGRIVVTPTHLDIEFDGHDVDPAVRIAGLDLDPGWVPWLGRVVCFHYDYSKVRSFPKPGAPA